MFCACETLSGDKRAALGLVGVAVRAGARSTLGSLWQVNDEATALLMSNFYQELAQQNSTKVEALRQAQLSLLNNPRFEAILLLIQQKSRFLSITIKHINL